jgi:hypothetical protein
MAAQSDNKYDVYNWIMRVYDSCKTVDQIHSAGRLVNNFYKLYQDYGLDRDLHDYHLQSLKRLSKLLKR